MKNKVLFIGEDNKTNNELFQLLNWRFQVTYYNDPVSFTYEELKEGNPAVLIVSMVGNRQDYHELFDYMMKECRETPVITISTKTESEAYESYYDNKQFVKILRPILGKRVLEICRKVIVGSDYQDEEEETSKHGEKRHILVVDDNAMVLRNIKSVLESQYSVAVAPSGVHAFLSMGKKMPDLILLDYEMPGMNGKEVLEKIQEDEELKEIPVLFLTSMDNRDTVLKLLTLRPAGYILKPPDFQMLLEKIENIIGK
ncbi:MAG: response regulator [Lachnospiraceae bacterium]|nr:response regulator [Lachnospiraceae bacterium]